MKEQKKHKESDVVAEFAYFSKFGIVWQYDKYGLKETKKKLKLFFNPPRRENPGPAPWWDTQPHFYHSVAVRTIWRCV